MTPSLRRLAAAAFSLLAFSRAALAGDSGWTAVSADELAGQSSSLYPDAPAEVLAWNIDVDDRDFPTERRTQEYIRYKIYDPEKATDVTRLSTLILSSNGEELNAVEIHARLTLPGGRTREFGPESIHERTVQKQGGEQSWLQRLFVGQGTEAAEKFLAIEGIEAGAVLEYRFARTEQHPPLLFGRSLQKVNIPVRSVSYRHRIADNSDYIPRGLMANGGGADAEFHFDRKTFTLYGSGRNLPALVDEPFSGPVFDRSVTVLGGYIQRGGTVQTRRLHETVSVDARKDGPWASYAALTWMTEADAVEESYTVRKLAAQLTAGASSDEEKAKRIHDYVHGLYLKYQRSHRGFRVVWRTTVSNPVDYVISFDKHPDVGFLPQDFLWLAMSLDQATGLQAQAVLLPNRARIGFSPNTVLESLLPEVALRVKIGGGWSFSLPQTAAPVPFGMLPPANAGSLGLVVHTGPQEFIPVPAAEAGQSTIANSGSFSLDENGALAGSARRVLTGEPAVLLRTRLRSAGTEERVHQLLQRYLRNEFASAQVELTSFSGADDLESPLALEYTVRWAGYAELAGDRLIFRPSIFHGQSASPFSADKRVNLIQFPYAWKEVDDVSLQLPAGCKLEAPAAPASLPGQVLSYQVAIYYRPARGLINLKREFLSSLSQVPAERYGELKRCYDMMAQNDGHELVAVVPAAAPSKPSP